MIFRIYMKLPISCIFVRGALYHNISLPCAQVVTNSSDQPLGTTPFCLITCWIFSSARVALYLQNVENWRHPKTSKVGYRSYSRYSVETSNKRSPGNNYSGSDIKLSLLNWKKWHKHQLLRYGSRNPLKWGKPRIRYMYLLETCLRFVRTWTLHDRIPCRLLTSFGNFKSVTPAAFYIVLKSRWRLVQFCCWFRLMVIVYFLTIYGNDWNLQFSPSEQRWAFDLGRKVAPHVEKETSSFDYSTVHPDSI
jgi:hypothetical protein